MGTHQRRQGMELAGRERALSDPGQHEPILRVSCPLCRGLRMSTGAVTTASCSITVIVIADVTARIEGLEQRWNQRPASLHDRGCR